MRRETLFIYCCLSTTNKLLPYCYCYFFKHGTSHGPARRWWWGEIQFHLKPSVQKQIYTTASHALDNRIGWKSKREKMLPKINNVGDENASSTLFSSSLRSYVPRHKKSQNPFSKEWLGGVIDDVRNVREKEQLRVLQMQMLEIEKKSEDCTGRE